MSTPTKNTEGLSLSAREINILVCIFQGLNGRELKIDYAHLAEATGMPSTNAASLAWYRLKKKLEGGGGSGEAKSEDGTATPTKPAKPAKKAAAGRKRKAAAAAPVKAESDGGGSDGIVDGSDDATSECIAGDKRGAKKAKTVKDEPSTDDDSCKGDVV